MESDYERLICYDNGEITRMKWTYGEGNEVLLVIGENKH